MGVEGNQELYKQYIAELGEYNDLGKPEQHDFQNPNQGWKLHLNVSPSNVKGVSEFLKLKGFVHKFLKEANIDSGKIFTVYIGSRALTEKAVKVIQDEIGDLLDDPKTQKEIFASPKIVARFALYEHPDFIGRAYYQGIPLMKYYDEDDLTGSAEKSKNRLDKEFGEYFGGGITYYEPNPSTIRPGEKFEDFLKRTTSL
jgi:hypothetical protein